MKSGPRKLVVGALALVGLLAVPAQSKPLSMNYTDKFADVDFSWSSEAATVPALVHRFRAAFAKEKVGSISCGKEESEARIATGGEGIKCESSTKVTTSGNTPRLLSLASEYWAFTGGAHGNGATRALLWDRRLNKEIAFASLFVPGSVYETVLRSPYCAALNRERKKRRGNDERPSPISEFDSCPKLSDLALIPAASQPGRSLDRIHLIAAPYLAGPYAEGEYDIALPVSPRLVQLMNPEYRSSFQAQRQ
jgi:hypothetical protein